MAKVLHCSRIIERRQHTVTTTLCGRMSNAAEDWNVADTDAQVTCKLCLKKIAIRDRMQQRRAVSAALANA